MKNGPRVDPQDPDSAARSVHKIVELESLRGLAALLVVVFHLPRWNAWLFDVPFVRHSYVMVDLFFVLSGVVICRAYGATINGLNPLLRFQFLRLGRLYPTHLVFFAFFLALETAKYLVSRHGGVMAMDDPPFHHNNGTAVWQHLLLVQAIGPGALPMTFNFPAWSISVEFYVYAIFGLIVWRLGTMQALIFAGLAAGSIVMLAADLESGWEYLLRGVAGFFSGCCVALAARSMRARARPTWVWCGLALIVLFTAFKPDAITWDPAIYPLAGLTILAILRTAPGSALHLLRSAWPAYLGKVSYSVYMCHAAVIWAITTVLRRATHLPQATWEGMRIPQLSLVQAGIVYVVTLICVLATAHVVYRCVEAPVRRRSRQWAARRFSTSAGSTFPQQ